MDTVSTEILHRALLSKYTFRLRPAKRLTLPKFRGALFRGGFGKALLNAVCPENACNQNDCPQRLHCAYSYIFETPVPDDADVLRLNTHVTHPFIIEPPHGQKGVYEGGDALELNLTLIGKAIDYLPYCVFAFERLGIMGIGRERVQYGIENVVAADNQVETVIFSGREKRFLSKGSALSFNDIMNGRGEDRQRWQRTGSLEVQYITPARFEHDGVLVAEGLEFHILLRSILRRLSTLIYFHCGKLALPIDYKQLIEDARGITIGNGNLAWEDHERYSARKGKRMKLGGLTGSIWYQGNLEPFVPFLLLAEYIHVGKSVSFGFGQVRIC